MRSFLRWAAFSVLVFTTSAAVAQQYNPIMPNYGRYGRNNAKVAYDTQLPSPYDTAQAVGSGVSKSAERSPFTKIVANTVANTVADETVTIPQQGSVDLGTGAAVPETPAHSAHSAHIDASSAYAGGSCSTGGCPSGDACGLDGQLGGGCSTCGSSSCGGCQLGNVLANKIGGGAHCSGWFGGVYYMLMWRDDDRFGLPLATSSADPTNTVLSTGMAHMKDASGLGIRIGKMLSPCSALEFIYWQIFENDSTAIAQNSHLGSTVNSSLAFTNLQYDSLVGPGPVPVDDFFQDSQYQSVTREFEYTNFEVNFLRLPYTFAGGNCNNNVRLALLGGVRYFRAEESFKLFSDDLNEIPGDDPNHELCYLNEMENHLVGFQVGGLLNYQLSSKLSGQFGSKAGIYNNHMTQVQSVAGGAGGAIISAGPDTGQPFALRSKKDDVAFLGEFDAGLSYCVNNRCRITGGYKVLAISSYADSVNQIPYSFSSLSTAGLIQDNNSLILHGLYVGVETTW